MAVPKMSQLQPGISVNVVLKADQRSGRLTTGSVSEILTKGNHPRGIKVRLTNGQVGRVQSLSEPSNASTLTQALPPTSNLQNIPEYISSYAPRQSRTPGCGERKARFTAQDDYRDGRTPVESHNLADYIKSPASSKKAAAFGSSVDENSVQRQLEIDFPKLDTALIAAILADHDEPESVRDVLYSLS